MMASEIRIASYVMLAPVCQYNELLATAQQTHLRLHNKKISLQQSKPNQWAPQNAGKSLREIETERLAS